MIRKSVRTNKVQKRNFKEAVKRPARRTRVNEEVVEIHSIPVGSDFDFSYKGGNDFFDVGIEELQDRELGDFCTVIVLSKEGVKPEVGGLKEFDTLEEAKAEANRMIRTYDLRSILAKEGYDMDIEI